MAAIPSSGSLIATHDYYRSESDGAYTCIWIVLYLCHSGSLFLPLSFCTNRKCLFIPGRLGSASSNSSCGSAEHIGEVIPHHPGIKKVYFSLFLDFFKCMKVKSPCTNRSSCLTCILFFAGLPRQDSGHWWTSFFFAKQVQPGMQNVSENQK